jgi:hypothetical protein
MNFLIRKLEVMKAGSLEFHDRNTFKEKLQQTSMYGVCLPSHRTYGRYLANELVLMHRMSTLVLMLTRAPGPYLGTVGSCPQIGKGFT